MNWKRLFFISTIFWIGAFMLTNCSPKTMKLKDYLKSGLVEKCNGPDCVPEKQIAYFRKISIESNVSLLSPNSKSLPTVDGITPKQVASDLGLIRGFRFSAAEVQAMGAFAKGQKDSADRYVYAMFALNKDLKRNRRPDEPQYLDMWLQVKTEKNSYTFNRRKLPRFDGFLDFPKPCPHFCPDTTYQSYK